MEKGGNSPCILNAANEVAVELFLQDKIGFLAMSDLINTCLNKVEFIAQPNYQDYINTDLETRKLAFELSKK
jgi:1-deoxy-D-xylulose-5-phosphate reductoisomerase